MSIEKHSVAKRKCLSLSGRFDARLFSDADGRLAIVREIKRRLAALRRDAAVNSTQKEMLAQRAVFIALRLEAWERDVAEGKPIDDGKYAQSVNCLLGLLRCLGLAPKHNDKKKSLQQYLAEQKKEEGEET